MTHLFTVPQPEFEALQGSRRHLIVKDQTTFALEDTALVQSEDGNHREQLEFKITFIQHGKGSARINAKYCLLGLYAPYRAIDDIPDSVG